VQCFVLNDGERHWSIPLCLDVDGSAQVSDSPTLNRRHDFAELFGGHSVSVPSAALAGSVVKKRNANVQANTTADYT